jgi:ligand-binding SRPBCC domain-containing protein
MRHHYDSEQWLPYPVEFVFAFFANPENLPRLMPGWQQARIQKTAYAPPPSHPATDSPTQDKGISAGAGTRMTLTFRPFPYAPVRISWEAEISEFVWNDHFCDHQLRGPFAYWHHCHSVRPDTRPGQSGALISGTLLHDEVDYEIPFGKLGNLARHLFIARQLRNTFTFRHTRTLELLLQMQSRANTQT